VAAHSRADSATGGSADTQAVDLDARQWRTRRGAALAVRAAAILVPVATSVAAARVVAVLMPRPDSVARTAIWWLCVAAAAVLTLATVDRLARRLLPLAALCRLALVFPDRAPSRFRVALRAGTAHQLEQRIRAGGALGVTVTEAAENLLVLVASLTRHDRLTRGHSERVRAYADLIAEEMNLPRHDRERLHWSALVHDVGKMHVRPAVLNKRGRPDEVEWAELRNHPAAAAPIVEPLRPWPTRTTA
jgi:HD-GYP domain-containing protein (c-di-GMP phosphodiesterase class II)